MCDVTVFRAARAGTEKTPAFTAAEIDEHLNLMLAIAQRLGYSGKASNRILDFGCGIGATVSAMVTRGMDAYGVDVGEWWGKDYDAYWHDSPVPSDNICSRLSTVSEAQYRLPYPDNHFDLIISSQVFEHVFNYVDVFRELARIMKPDAVSVHIFPGRGTPIETHVFVPFTPLAKKEWWLRLWALVKRRHRVTWREEFEYLRDQMRSNNYPSRTELRAAAVSADAHLEFREDIYLELNRGRPWKVLQAGRRIGLGGMLTPLLRRMCQRTMVVTKGRPHRAAIRHSCRSVTRRPAAIGADSPGIPSDSARRRRAASAPGNAPDCP